MNKDLARILIIDDDPDIGMMIKTMLEYKGYSVVVAQKAEKAEELLRTEHFDVVIMDMLLSGVHGVDICGRIKKDKSISHIPVIMMSAHPNAKEICKDAGADEFVSKPFDMQGLLSTINRLVQLQK